MCQIFVGTLADNGLQVGSFPTSRTEDKREIFKETREGRESYVSAGEKLRICAAEVKKDKHTFRFVQRHQEWHLAQVKAPCSRGR